MCARIWAEVATKVQRSVLGLIFLFLLFLSFVADVFDELNGLLG